MEEIRLYSFHRQNYPKHRATIRIPLMGFTEDFQKLDDKIAWIKNGGCDVPSVLDLERRIFNLIESETKLVKITDLTFKDITLDFYKNI